MCNIQSYGKQIDTRKSTWTRIKVVHATQQIISISIVGTVVIFDFKTLKSVSFQLSILLYVFFSYKFVFWSRTERKEEKTALMILENGPTKHFHIYLWDCGQLKSISILWSPFFPIEDSFTYFLVVCKVYTGVLDRGWNEKNEKKQAYDLRQQTPFWIMFITPCTQTKISAIVYHPEDILAEDNNIMPAGHHHGINVSRNANLS